MPVMLQKGQTGTLRFIAGMAGLDESTITNVQWQPQGGQNAVKFHSPDKVEGLAPGIAAYKCSVTMGPGEKAVYSFEVECMVPGPPPTIKMIPVGLDVDVTSPPPQGVRQ